MLSNQKENKSQLEGEIKLTTSSLLLTFSELFFLCLLEYNLFIKKHHGREEGLELTEILSPHAIFGPF